MEVKSFSVKSGSIMGHTKQNQGHFVGLQLAIIFIINLIFFIIQSFVFFKTTKYIFSIKSKGRQTEKILKRGTRSCIEYFISALKHLVGFQIFIIIYLFILQLINFYSIFFQIFLLLFLSCSYIHSCDSIKFL